MKFAFDEFEIFPFEILFIVTVGSNLDMKYYRYLKFFDSLIYGLYYL